MLPYKTLIGLSFFLTLSLAAPLRALDASESTLHARSGSPKSSSSSSSSNSSNSPSSSSSTNSPYSPYSPCSGKDCGKTAQPKAPLGKICFKNGVPKADVAGTTIQVKTRLAETSLPDSDQDYVCYEFDAINEDGK